MKLLKFEWKKIWRKKKLTILFLVVIAGVLGVFIRNEFMQHEVQGKLILFIDHNSTEIADLILENEKRSAEQPDDENLREMLHNLYAMETALSGLKFYVSQEEWKEYPSHELRFLEHVATHVELGGIFEVFNGYELEQRIEKNKILIENGLPYEDDQYSLALPNFIKIAATIILSIVGILMIAFIMGDQLSDEFENHTIKTLYSQPVRKWQVILTKYISLLITALIVIFLFFMGSYGLELPPE